MSETLDAYVLAAQGPISSIRGFTELPELAEQSLAGAIRGRTVVDIGR